MEETPKKLKEVIEVCFAVRNAGKDVQLEAQVLYNMEARPLVQEYWHMREQILRSEFILLQTLGFDLVVDHPYTYLLKYVKGLKGDRNLVQGDRHLAQIAWNFVNDR